VAPVGSFPKGTEVRITTIEDINASPTDIVNIQNKEDSLNVDPSAKKFSFDITFYNPDKPDEEIPPVE
jgi:hypothetical protein